MTAPRIQTGTTAIGRSAIPVAVAAVLFFVSACGESGQKAGDRRQVTVYCSVDSAFARPILAAFEERAGIRVNQVFDTEAGKTTGLVNRILAEKKAPRADVWWSSEVFGTMQLAESGVLASYRPATASDIPQQYRDPQGLWTAFGLRGRVIAYDPARMRHEDLPARWADLTDPKYKGRFQMADPRFGTTRGHMAVLLSLWGRDALSEFCRGLVANDARVAGGNAQAVVALARGQVDLVATDTDDVIVARRRGDSVAMHFPDLDSPDGSRRVAGTLWIPCSLALVAGGPHPDEARRLIDYLASAEIERRLRESDSRNYPVRPALRDQLDVVVPSEARIDYAAAAARLIESDALMQDVLLR